MYSTSSLRFAVSKLALVAVVTALALCGTDAATVVLKIKEEAMMMKPKSTTTVATLNSTTTTVASVLKNNSAGHTNFIAQNLTVAGNNTDTDEDDMTAEDEPMSPVWYLAAFGGLVLFFFVVSCSELFVGHPIYVRRQAEVAGSGYLRRHVYGIRNQKQKHCSAETPPPPYHLFAPPSYDDFVVKGSSGLKQQQPEFMHQPGCKFAEVYVVPVHAATEAMTTEAAAAAAVDVKTLPAVLPPSPPQIVKS